MKTTLDIDDRLLARAKARAAHERKSLTRLIEEGLNLRLRPREEAVRRSKSDIPVFRDGGGFAPGIDPLSNESIYDAEDS